MKLLLRRKVSKLGTIGDLVEVKDGYARNYLLPQGLAIAPTEQNIKQVESEKARYLEELAKQRAELQVRADAVNGKEITIASRANEEGQLYGSVGPAQIAAALTEGGWAINPDEVILAEPIRKLDKYDVSLDFDEDITATVGVWVVPLREDGTAGEPGDIPAPIPPTEDILDQIDRVEPVGAEEDAPADDEEPTAE